MNFVSTLNSSLHLTLDPTNSISTPDYLQMDINNSQLIFSVVPTLDTNSNTNQYNDNAIGNNTNSPILTGDIINTQSSPNLIVVNNTNSSVKLTTDETLTILLPQSNSTTSTTSDIASITSPQVNVSSNSNLVRNRRDILPGNNIPFSTSDDVLSHTTIPISDAIDSVNNSTQTEILTNSQCKNTNHLITLQVIIT